MNNLVLATPLTAAFPRFPQIILCLNANYAPLERDLKPSLTFQPQNQNDQALDEEYYTLNIGPVSDLPY